MTKYMKDFNGEEIFCLEYDKSTLVDMVTDLQERIDKAIDYIDRKAHHGDCIIPTTILELKNKDYYKLIEILKGSE